MSKCPICDTENAPGVTVCDFCGSELPQESASAAGSQKYYVGIDRVGDDRAAVIQAVEALCKCTFEEARDKIDGEGIVLTNVSKLQAEIACTKLRGAGATASMGSLEENVSAPTSSASSNTKTTNSTASTSGSFLDNPNYGIISIVLTFFFFIVGFVMSLIGMTKSNNESVKKTCRVGVIIGVVAIVFYIVFFSVIGSMVGGAGGGDYYY